MQNAQDEWLDWRCAALRKFYGEVARRIAQKRPDLRLVLTMYEPMFYQVLADPELLNDPDPSAKSTEKAGWTPNSTATCRTWFSTGRSTRPIIDGTASTGGQPNVFLRSATSASIREPTRAGPSAGTPGSTSTIATGKTRSGETDGRPSGQRTPMARFDPQSDHALRDGILPDPACLCRHYEFHQRRFPDRHPRHGTPTSRVLPSLPRTAGEAV